MTNLDYSPLTLLLTDVDDTLTTQGRLSAETYHALCQLADAGVSVIPITGGCAGWCDMMLRTWPVAAVIGEGGAFYGLRSATGSVEWQFWDSAEQHRSDQAAILQTLKEMPLSFDVALAKDQSLRWVDVAIDYRQDAHLTKAQADQLCTTFIDAGFQAKCSSIHINVWRGDFNKAAMAKRLLRDVFKLDEAAAQQQVLFIGDAPNDEPMFEAFPNSVGVANIVPHLATMTHQPKQLTQGKAGTGFVEMANAWLSNLRDRQG
ncbi:HAD-IIB family hydrolase [Saccharospirillum sp. HFRX-1]|uniref:HAD-IIB family hydrolase n=1 Tax=unclassified Saccharospirillum TaxID=2633430 RepID=UPI00371D88C5